MQKHLIASLLAGVALLGVSVSALAADPIVYNNKPASATTDYWTADRMATARPIDLMRPSGARKVPAAAVPAPSGTPGVAGGTTALPQSAQDEIEFGSPEPADGAYPGPHTTFTLSPSPAKPPYTAFPYSPIGRLFFHDPVGGGNFVCTATATYGGANLNIVWTAGHCVANGGHSQFYNNWLFCPAWNKNQGGVNPTFGCWSWAYASTKNRWFVNGAFTKDVAYVGLQATGSVLAKNVVSATGGLGFAWNWGRDQNWVHIGYPAASPYDGGYQVQTNTEHRYNDAPDALGPPTNSWGSAQTQGSSGSAVQLFWSLGGGFINSNVSYSYSAGPNGNEFGHELYGPYYDTDICVFWKAATGWGGTC